MKIKNIIYLFFVNLLIFELIGCDAFVRKFTRKRKKDNIPQEEMVLAPEEYKGPGMSKEELYRQYFLFWQSWQDELISALFYHASQKKRISCAEEAIKNLVSLRGLLNAEQQKKLDVYINQVSDLKEQISRDLYGNNTNNHILSAERIKRNILRDFSYSKIKDYLA